ncbi:DNA-methyltransferase [Seohaeicola zhoushanensis]|uniref:Methyltransferase n=1 Tax=Seohaeicola zhoushanensis TaxID=1569283 RepID=A0A8J3GVV5_9RHOB|nr:site-specific DNA-methyltransferase [Seohaeicola zhoushanensis]GHF40827.1 methyltransferase [Seohaeicola zhoushanensis]
MNRIVSLPDQPPGHSLAVCDNRDFLARLPAGAFNLIVTSPPYNNGKPYERRSTLGAYVEEQRAVIGECVRLLAETGSICWQVGNHVDDGEVVPLDALLYPVFKSFGLRLRNRIVWHYGHGLHCSRRLSGRYETILWFTKSDDYVFNLDAIRMPAKFPGKRHYKGPKAGALSGNPLGKNPSDIWEIPNVKAAHVEKTLHPCQFPVELVERLVLALTDPGDSVLDPYVGVGSSVIAALKHRRWGFGCDISEEYVAIARTRIAQLERGELRLRERDTPIYDPALPRGGHNRRKRPIPSE